MVRVFTINFQLMFLITVDSLLSINDLASTINQSLLTSINHQNRLLIFTIIIIIIVVMFITIHYSVI